MAKYLKISFLEIINNAEWLDESTRKEAIQKLQKLKILISNESWVEDPQEIEKKYEEVSEYFETISKNICFNMYHESCMDTFFRFPIYKYFGIKNRF